MSSEHLRTRRTDETFEDYVVTVKKSEHAVIHRIGKPNTRVGEVVFINVEGVLAVTGDYGNWIFCREFHPSKDGYVSDGYWCEKLKTSSPQTSGEFSPDKTEEEINERLKEEDLNEECKVYYESLLNYVHDGEIYYLGYAHSNMPDGMDHENVPFVKEMHYWLKAVFDAFDEICRRMENESSVVQ